MPAPLPPLSRIEGATVMAGIDSDGRPQRILVGSDGGLAVSASETVPGFSIPSYDHIGITYYTTTNNPHVVTYKTGGSGGPTVATLTLTYVNAAAADDDKVASVTKS